MNECLTNMDRTEEIDRVLGTRVAHEDLAKLAQNVTLAGGMVEGREQPTALKCLNQKRRQ